MKLFIERENITKELNFVGSVEDLLIKFSINPSTVVIVKNGTIVLEDEKIGEEDNIKLLSVISGG